MPSSRRSPLPKQKRRRRSPPRRSGLGKKLPAPEPPRANRPNLRQLPRLKKRAAWPTKKPRRTCACARRDAEKRELREKAQSRRRAEDEAMRTMQARLEAERAATRDAEIRAAAERSAQLLAERQAADERAAVERAEGKVRDLARLANELRDSEQNPAGRGCACRINSSRGASPPSSTHWKQAQERAQAEKHRCRHCRATRHSRSETERRGDGSRRRRRTAAPDRAVACGSRSNVCRRG